MKKQVEQAEMCTDAIERARSACVGEVGIFWFFKGNVISDSVSHSLGEEYGNFVNGRSDHCTFWPSIQRLSPEAAKYEYDQVPRGRVVYNRKDDRFFVYGSEKFVRNERQKGMVLSKFNLPPDKTFFRADEHYASIPGMLEE